MAKVGIGIKDKNCLQCGLLMTGVNSSKVTCDECKEFNQRNKEKKNYHKPKYSKEEYEENFNNCTTTPYLLTTKGFNSISHIKISAYRQYFKMKWCDIVTMYGKIDVLYEYIKSEYIKFCDMFASKDIATFGQKYHEFITYDLLQWFTTDKIMTDCGKIKMVKYSKEDLINNFITIKNIVGDIPLYSEFEDLTEIPLVTYASHYQLKGKIYDRIIDEMGFSDEEILQYKKRKSSHKTEQGKLTGIMSSNPISLDVLEIEFKQVFEKCLKDFGVIPPRRLFNKLSKHDDSIYRKKLNMTWMEICEFYGYKRDKTSNRAEKIVLEIVKSIIVEDYVPQKTWNWLIGVGGKNMYCDGFYPNLNLVVEFDGSQHRKPIDKFGGEKAFVRLRENDLLKEKLLKDNDIMLIRIPSNEPWHDAEFIKSILNENKISVA